MRTRSLKYILPAAVFLGGLLLGALFFGGGGEEAKAPGEVHSEETGGDPTLWTCSMHPAIKLPEPGKCPICFMDLIPLKQDLGSENPTQLAMSVEAMKLAEITTVPVERRNVQIEIRTVGKVMVDERRLKKITAWTGGRLERLFVDFTGVHVNKGAPLVEIYSPELYSAQVELIEALRAQEELGSSRVAFIRTTADATVRAAREKLRLLGLGGAQIMEIESGGVVRERITIPAPIGGIVVRKVAVEGDYVKTGSPIYTIADLSKVWVMLDAYESDLIWIREDQQVEFEVEAYPGVTFSGTVAFIDPVLNPRTRTVSVRVNADNPDGRLKPDMFVHARLQSEFPEDRPLVIPASAALRTGRRAVVYVRVPNTERPMFEGRQIVLGPRAGDDYIVESGLSEGELVVVKGNFKIDSEMQIQARPSMMSPEGGAPAPGHAHGGSGGGGDETAATESMEAGMDHSETSEEEGPAGRLASLEEAAIDWLKGIPPALREELSPLYGPYLSAQRALAEDDAEGARSSLERLGSIFQNVRAKDLSGGALETWNALSREIEGGVQLASASTEISGVREAFSRVTCAVVALERSIGPPAGETHRLAFCPMAFDDRGAYWIQTDEEIQNPYLGQMMPRCGTIEKTFGGQP